MKISVVAGTDRRDATIIASIHLMHVWFKIISIKSRVKEVSVRFKEV
jgi:hypothetical protein